MDFKQAETKFKQLKAQFEAGALTENAFKAKLEELMIRDERGDWWMIGYETERWYRNNGTEWVQADPPGSQTGEPALPSNWASYFWSTLGWIIGGAMGGWLYWEMDDIGITGGIIAGVIGGLVTAIIFYIGQVRSILQNILFIMLGWALGGAIGWPVGEALTEASGAAVGGAIFGVIGWGSPRALNVVLPIGKARCGSRWPGRSVLLSAGLSPGKSSSTSTGRSAGQSAGQSVEQLADLLRSGG